MNQGQKIGKGYRRIRQTFLQSPGDPRGLQISVNQKDAFPRGPVRDGVLIKRPSG